LEAAANPARTRELYFVADGTGGHTFTDSFDQHQKAVAKLRAHERQQNGGAKPEPAPQPEPEAASSVAPPIPPPAPRPARRR
jgi:UPF0755 protein